MPAENSSSPAVNPALEALRWRRYPVLDDGCVALVDCMGTDAAIVQAARVSYGAGTRRVSDDRNLIRYLMRHRHTTPFEMCEVKFFVRVPMDTWRQMVRHRTFNINEYSTRYSIAIDAAQKTPPDAWRTQSQSNRQGSEGRLPETEGAVLSRREAELHAEERAFYEDCLARGVAREQVRKNLPLCTYTELYWKNDLHNLFHFLSLRLDAHAQWEVRQYAAAIAEIVRQLFPLSWEAFEDYRLRGMFLTQLDVEILCNMAGSPVSEEKFLAEHQPEQWRGLKRCRERDEAIEKLRRLGFLEPD